MTFIAPRVYDAHSPYSQYSSGSFPSMARMFARAQSSHMYSVPRRSNPTVHPAGIPAGAQGLVRPHLEHVRDVGAAARANGARGAREDRRFAEVGLAGTAPILTRQDERTGLRRASRRPVGRLAPTGSTGGPPSPARRWTVH